MQWLKNVSLHCGNRCEKENLIRLYAMLLATKMLPDFMNVRHVRLRIACFAISLATCDTSCIVQEALTAVAISTNGEEHFKTTR